MLSGDRVVHNMRLRPHKGDIFIFHSTIPSKSLLPIPFQNNSLYSPPVFIRKTGIDGHVRTIARYSALGCSSWAKYCWKEIQYQANRFKNGVPPTFLTNRSPFHVSRVAELTHING
jgi:hypothetical protein